MSLNGNGLLKHFSDIYRYITLIKEIYYEGNILPEDNQFPYSEIGEYLQYSGFPQFVIKTPDEQVIQYKDKDVIMKRFVFPAKGLKGNDILWDNSIMEIFDKIIFGLSINAHLDQNFLFNFYEDIKLVTLNQKNLVIIEYLTKIQGTPIENYLRYKIEINRIKIIKQLLSTIKLLIQLNIFDTEIKLENCIVDRIGDLKIIDYKAYLGKGFYTKCENRISNADIQNCPGLVAFEKYLNFDGKINNKIFLSEVNNSLLPDIKKLLFYSTEFLIFCFAGVIDLNTFESRLKSDKNKNLEEIQKSSFEYINQFNLSQNKLFLMKIQCLLYEILNYNPQERIDKYDFNLLLDVIDDLKVSIGKFYELMLKRITINNPQNITDKIEENKIPLNNIYEESKVIKNGYINTQYNLEKVEVLDKNHISSLDNNRKNDDHSKEEAQINDEITLNLANNRTKMENILKNYFSQLPLKVFETIKLIETIFGQMNFQNRTISKWTKLIEKPIYQNNNGSHYLGQWDSQGGKTGIGIEYYDNGSLYIGNWKNNLYHGFGRYLFIGNNISNLLPIKDPLPNASEDNDIEKFKKIVEKDEEILLNNLKEYGIENIFYEGDFFQGKMQGKGKMIERKKSIYVGELFDNQACGKGKAFWIEGIKYEGDFAYYCHGKGKAISINGNQYEGEFEKHQFQGEGKLFLDGDLYEGSFKNSLFNGNGNITYKNGDKYKGPFLNGKKEGIGVLEYQNKETYKGEFQDDQRHGRGTLYFPDGIIFYGRFEKNIKDDFGTYILPDKTKFIGVLKNNKKEGEGIMYSPNKETYIGIFINDKKNGIGKLIKSDEIIYIGNFQDDILIGPIKRIRLTDSSIYEGEFFNNKLNGLGKISWSNGDHYEGGFKDGWMEGFGNFKRSNGDSYQGEFKYGKINGKGRYKIHKGPLIIGEFVNEKMNDFGRILMEEYEYLGECEYNKFGGPGILKYSNGNEYIGYFKNNQKHGVGKFSSKVQNFEYEGEFRNDKMDGFGVCKFLDNDSVYKGNYFNDKMQGKGELLLKDGTKYIGFFENDKKNGLGYEYYPESGSYEGNFKNNLKHGEGKFTWKDGKTYTGNYENDQIKGHGTYKYNNGLNIEQWFNGNNLPITKRITWPDQYSFEFRLEKGEMKILDNYHKNKYRIL